MDFTEELTQTPELAFHLRNAINTKAVDILKPDDLKESPKLDNDFSKHIIVNGLPKCDENKASKLIQLIIKLFAKRNFIITEENIEINFDSNKMSTG